jgi:hypothetical protein
VSDDEPTICEIGEVQLRIPAARTRDLVPLCRRGSIWQLGLMDNPMWRGVVTPDSWIMRPQLVFAGGADPDSGGYGHRCRNSLRCSPCGRLEDSYHCIAQWSSSHRLCAGDDNGFGSEVASQCFGVFRCRRSVAPGRVSRLPVEPGRIASTEQAGSMRRPVNQRLTADAATRTQLWRTSHAI